VFRFYTCQTHLLFVSRWRPDFFSLIRLWEVDYKQKLKHAGLLSPDGHQAPYVAGEVVCVRGFSHVVGRALLIHVERTTFVLCCGVAFFLLRRLMCPLRWPCMFCLFRVFMLWLGQVHVPVPPPYCSQFFFFSKLKYCFSLKYFNFFY